MPSLLNTNEVIYSLCTFSNSTAIIFLSESVLNYNILLPTPTTSLFPLTSNEKINSFNFSDSRLGWWINVKVAFCECYLFSFEIVYNLFIRIKSNISKLNLNYRNIIIRIPSIRYPTALFHLCSIIGLTLVSHNMRLNPIRSLKT